MDDERIAELKKFLHMQSCIWPADGEGACIDTLHYIAELEQQVNFHTEVKAAFKETADSLLAENSELREQLSYQTDRAESFCTRLHEEEQRNTELRKRVERAEAEPYEIIKDLQRRAEEWRGKQGDWIKHIVGGDCGYISTLLHNVANGLATQHEARKLLAASEGGG